MSDTHSMVSRLLPGGSRFFTEHGEFTLSELGRRLDLAGPPPSVTAVQAVLEAVEAVYGPAFSPQVRAVLEEGRPCLSANHLGFDTHPEMVQAILLFQLARNRPDLDGEHGRPVVVLACGVVPLRSPTCPGGFLLGRRAPDGRRLRVLAFPRSQDECLAGQAPALNRRLTEKFRSRLLAAPLRPAEGAVAAELLDRAAGPDFFDRPNFASQAAVFNHHLWAGLTGGLGDVLYVEMETLVGRCLEADLADADSPAARTLFEAGVRGPLLARLADRAGCWSRDLLDGRLGQLDLADASRARGTVFFWEISPQGRRYPMCLRSSGGKGAWLAGRDLSLPLKPEPLALALRANRIKPGLFLDHLVLAWHGLAARGGVFMLDYLPGLLRPAAEILERPSLAEYAARARWLAAGGLPVRAPGGPDEPAWQRESAAGALELAAAGPWGPEGWRSLAGLRLNQIWPFTASEWYLEETRPEGRPPDWADRLESLRCQGRGLTLSG